MKKTENTKQPAISEIMQSFRRIFRAIQQYSEEVLKEFGVTGPQLWLLKTLRERDGASVGELSQKMYLHISTVSGIIDRLEEKGYVVRKRGMKDRRVVIIRLTPGGKNIISRAPEPAQGKLLHGLQKLSHQEVIELQEALRKIVDMMEVEYLNVKFFYAEE
jgi:MarR family transcriptional regulator, organic hydroperoxide resistance regulator